MTPSPRTPSHQIPAAFCEHARSVARIETPLITDLAAVIGHLEAAAGRAGAPAEEARAYGGGVSEDLLRSWVLGNAARIRAALDRITTPYEPSIGSAHIS